MDVALFTLGLVAAGVGVVVHWPPRRPGELAAIAFMPSWLAGELPIHFASIVVVGAAVTIGAGGLTGIGWVGLALSVIALASAWVSWSSVAVVRARAHALGVEVPRYGFWRYAVPLWLGDRFIVKTHTRVNGVEADVYRSTDVAPVATPNPAVLVYVHGGGWVLGFRRWQGRLLMRRLVRAGWIAVSIEYRRWPRVRWPGPLDDVRAALAWARTMLVEWGADPARVVVSGNSAGAHLAALATLSDRATPRIAACVVWYGVFDLVDDERVWPHGGLKRLWSWLLFARGERGWAEASPLTHLHHEAPPFLVIHGSKDSLVPVGASRSFVKRLEALPEGPTRVTYFEVPGAQHAFDVFTSRRALIATEVAAQWLERRIANSERT